MDMASGWAAEVEQAIAGGCFALEECRERNIEPGVSRLETTGTGGL